MAEFTPIPTTEARRIAQHALLSPGEQGLEIETAQVEHRIDIINAWGIKPGSKVLEVGCGQGNCTTVLAEFVGPEGHVDAFDPASLDYGAPYTLRDAQNTILKGAMGERITFFNADLTEWLKENKEKTWDYVVFCHSIWYFDSREQFRELLHQLQYRAKAILVAEYALRATEPRAMPHVFAVAARAMLESFKPSSQANIRTPLDPSGITAEIKGIMNIDKEETTLVVPGPGLRDGSWEVGDVKSARYLREILDYVEGNTRHWIALRAARMAMMNSVSQIDVEGGQDEKIRAVRTMDVWVASFSTAARP